MKKCLRLGIAALAGMAVMSVCADPVVSSVEMVQDGDSGQVSISYKLGEERAIITLGIKVGDVLLPPESLIRLTGDVNCIVEPSGTERREISWDAGVDWPENITESAVAVITAWSLTDPPEIMVIDMREGDEAESFPLRFYTSIESLIHGHTNDIYKYDQLVMKRVEGGTFLMGNEQESQVSVTLTRDFYLGIYQVTQKQWRSVTGGTISEFGFTTRALRPAEMTSYVSLRGSKDDGYDWPNDGHDVDKDSFMGKLREKVSIMPGKFDLPTEAQWERACRSGYNTYYNDGLARPSNTISNEQMDVLGRYRYNGGRRYNDSGSLVSPSKSADPELQGTAIVGSYLPNAWWFYDMHGNVREVCLDWFQSSLPGGTDPKGPTSGSNRLWRGGSYDENGNNCQSFFRSGNIVETTAWNSLGFRLAYHLVYGEEEEEGGEE